MLDGNAMEESQPDLLAAVGLIFVRQGQTAHMHIVC